MKSTIQKARAADMKARAACRWAYHDVMHQSMNPISASSTSEMRRKLIRLSNFVDSKLNRDLCAQDILTFMENRNV